MTESGEYFIYIYISDGKINSPLALHMYVNICTIHAKNSMYNVKSDYDLLAAQVGRRAVLKH